VYTTCRARPRCVAAREGAAIGADPYLLINSSGLVHKVRPLNMTHLRVGCDTAVGIASAVGGQPFVVEESQCGDRRQGGRLDNIGCIVHAIAHQNLYLFMRARKGSLQLFRCS